MRCLNAAERKSLLDMLVEGRLVEIVYARVEPTLGPQGSIYLTIQPRKRDTDAHPIREPDTSRHAHPDASEFFTE